MPSLCLPSVEMHTVALLGTGTVWDSGSHVTETLYPLVATAHFPSPTPGNHGSLFDSMNVTLLVTSGK